MSISVPEKWDIETDVVVVGYGGAGATAAITASNCGAQVTVLEKMPSGGGNTRVSGGGLFKTTSMEWRRYVEALCFGATGTDVIEEFVRNAMENKDWIKEIGGEVEPTLHLQVSYPGPAPKASFPQLPGWESMEKFGVKGPDTEPNKAERLWKLLSGNVERRAIRVMMSTPARRLITNEKDEVIGVAAEKDGRDLFVKARRAVILTCGGFEFNDDLKRDFLPCKPFFAFGNPGNTGDGVRMAQKIGAGLWHMTATSAQLGFKAPEYESAFIIRLFTERFIYVNRDARRFADEAKIEVHSIAWLTSIFDGQRFRYLNIPAYAIFDETARRKAPLSPGNIGFNQNLYKWSSDNSAEIGKGWISKGKTIAELARKISVDEAALEKTVADYNDGCKNGRDGEFGRSRETLTAIDAPPYYAIELWPCLINTQGGPTRDKDGRVLDAEGSPIPRLYSAGELGSIWGFAYQGSGNNGESLIFGRIAGRNAAAERSWE
ncbi:MAG: FAD-binding protein [Chloroflexi bacterium]|nr:FAD-binding protein [Chloroflexota bacterium]